MKALVLHELHNGLRYETMERPSPKIGEVVVSLAAAGINHRDWFITQGLYAGIKFPTILGSDGAGWSDGQPVIIDPSFSWGKKSTFQGPDFHILGMPRNGTFAEAVCVPKENVHKMPAHLNFAQAAALPVAGVTAYRVLFSRCKLKKGERVLITGIGGGVALFCLQMAVAAGAAVWVTSGNGEKIEIAVAHGAKGGVSYKEAQWDKKLKAEVGGFDVIIDSAGGDSFGLLPGLCKPGARIGIYGGTLGKMNGISPQIIFWKQISVLGSSMGNPSDFAKMCAFVEKNAIFPVVDSVFNLSDGNLALEKIAAGAQFGKIILKISDQPIA